MNADTSEVKKNFEKEKNRTQTGHQSSERLSKTSVDYWKKKVKPRVVRGVETADLYVRLFEADREAWLCLNTPNRLTAAGKARDHWVRMKAIGLPVLLAELSPTPRPTRTATVGEAIEAASLLATVRPASFFDYAKKLRQIAGEIAKVKKPLKPKSRNAPDALAWRTAVNAVPLSIFTSERVNQWRAGRINAHISNPKKRKTAETTADSIIRVARAVFSADVLAAGLGNKITLPDPLPFFGVKYGPSHKRFISPVDPGQLFAAATSELEVEQHPQQFLAFSLCLLAGLRRSEADALTWPQVDLEHGVIRIFETDYFQPKSEDASREIEIDQMAIDIIRRAKADAPDPVFVLKGGEYRHQVSNFKTYRADASPHFTWRNLIIWLREKGISDPKPVHVLRKLAGSLVFQAHGIEQARGFLGHGDVSTTSRSYIAKTKRVVVSIPPPYDEVSKTREQMNGGEQ